MYASYREQKKGNQKDSAVSSHTCGAYKAQDAKAKAIHLNLLSNVLCIDKHTRWWEKGEATVVYQCTNQHPMLSVLVSIETPLCMNVYHR